MKSSQIDYSGRINCEECDRKCSIQKSVSNAPLQLIVKSDLEAVAESIRRVTNKIEEIENSSVFLEVQTALENHLANLASSAARYRFLSGSGLTTQSLSRYRRREPYRLSARSVVLAMKAVGMQDVELENSVAELAALQVQSLRVPEPVVTGIRGFVK